MFQFIIQKIRNKKWMMLSLLIGNILLIAIASSSALYSQAVLQRMLIRNMTDSMETTNQYPGLISMKASYVQLLSEVDGLEDFEEIEKTMDKLPDELGLPKKDLITQYFIPSTGAEPDMQVDGKNDKKLIKLGFQSDLQKHSKLIAGRFYSEEVKDGVLEVIVTERTLVEQNLLLDEVFTLPRILQPDGTPYKMKVVGVFENSQEQDAYWVTPVKDLPDYCFMPESVYRELLLDYENPQYVQEGRWSLLLDYQKLRSGDAAHVMEVLDKTAERMDKITPGGYKDNFRAILKQYLPEESKLNITLTVMQVPILILLGTFIFMVSRQMLELEQNEIAVFKSRGAGKGQILKIYFLQSLLISGASLLLGIPLGFLICQVLGASNAFLEFVSRTALQVSFSWEAVVLALCAAVVSVLAMVLPVFRYADLSIVIHKQQKQKKHKLPWWQKCGFDFILLGISIYGYYLFQTQKEFLSVQSEAFSMMIPLFYLCSSLFMIGAGLLAVRILPLIVRLIFRIGKKHWSPALYASFLRVIKAKDSQGFIIVFLVMTISLGIFNAQAARTINANGEERIRYQIGADVVLQEAWENNADFVQEGEEIIYYEPDFNRYQSIEGVKQATRVLVNHKVSAETNDGNISDVTLMGIHTKEFGQTAFMPEGLLSRHWYHYLNAMSQDSDAILVSSNFQSKYGYETGDVINYSNQSGDSIRGVIYGFVDYWPGYAPVVRTKGEDGLYEEKEKFLIVANLGKVQSMWGITPYQIWLDMEGSTQPVYDFASDEELRFQTFSDANAQLIELKNDPTFQGTNGVLTVGFIVVLTLCATGFLIYWILSIQSRVLQFGIFRAMGMSMKEIIYMLVNEQIFISGAAILVGVGVGILSSRLFVPMVQIGYLTSDQVLPLKIVSEWSDFVRLFIVIAVMIAACMTVLGVLISKIKISQALKLGED